MCAMCASCVVIDVANMQDLDRALPAEASMYSLTRQPRQRVL
jgi:hypothetical protein